MIVADCDGPDAVGERLAETVTETDCDCVGVGGGVIVADDDGEAETLSVDEKLRVRVGGGVIVVDNDGEAEALKVSDKLRVDVEDNERDEVIENEALGVSVRVGGRERVADCDAVLVGGTERLLVRLCDSDADAVLVGNRLRVVVADQLSLRDADNEPDGVRVRGGDTLGVVEAEPLPLADSDSDTDALTLNVEVFDALRIPLQVEQASRTITTITETEKTPHFIVVLHLTNRKLQCAKRKATSP